MVESTKKSSQPRSKVRISREAEALRRNLVKRKIQQSQREQLKKEKSNGQD